MTIEPTTQSGATPDDPIAIVDDDEAVRESTLRLLAKVGRNARIFESGDHFLAASLTCSFSCILLDVRMPGKDGLAVLQALARRKTPTPVVMLTGHDDLAIAAQAMRLGARDVLAKPYAPAALLAAIEAALAGRP